MTTDATVESDSVAAPLPRWSVTDLHQSFTARSFLAAFEQSSADTARLEALFDEHGIRALEPRSVTIVDGATADLVISRFNDWQAQIDQLGAYVYATVSTDSRNDPAQALSSELDVIGSRGQPLLARFVEWVASLGPEALATVSDQARDHIGPLQRLAERADHQMSEAEESLYSELSASSSSAWYRLHADVTSQLTALVTANDRGEAVARRLPMAAVRGLATHSDSAMRKAGYDAEMAAWPSVALVCAAAINGVKGDANVVNKRRNWDSPLDASLYSNSVSRSTFDAMQAAVLSSLPDFRSWMRTKSRLHGNSGALPWHDLVAPLPMAPSEISWDQGLHIVRNAFGSYGGELGGIVDRAISEQWIDAEPRDGKRGGAFCMEFFDDRSLVFLNWTGSVDSAQTTAHELGHAYHNTQLRHRTPLQKRLPMALAETASIFCETLVVEEGLQRLQGADRLALLDVDLQGSNQVIVDIHSRFLFETELFARRQRRTLGVSELNEMMGEAQLAAYGDGLDQTTAHPYMWAIKPHYYGSHFYNWPYTYGLLFGLGLFARYQADPDQFRHGYDDLLSRVGMNTAEELGAAFDLDVTSESFWIASIDVLRTRIADYDRLVTELGL
ncbi:MAG: M3 family oligoendopeptidase [Ilumatobacteraceae bacterium]